MANRELDRLIFITLRRKNGKKKRKKEILIKLIKNITLIKNRSSGPDMLCRRGTLGVGLLNDKIVIFFDS